MHGFLLSGDVLDYWKEDATIRIEFIFRKVSDIYIFLCVLEQFVILKTVKLMASDLTFSKRGIIICRQDYNTYSRISY